MAGGSGFNGECLIEFAYRRTHGAWRLVKNKIDRRIENKLGEAFFRDLRRDLRKTVNEWRPYKHEALLLEALGKLKFDQSVTKTLGPQLFGSCKKYSVRIVVGQRHQKKPHGLGII